MNKVMGIKTTKIWSNHLLLLLLVTAFLTMQWSSAHIHLSEQHNHDGIHHQHQTKTHAHNVTNQTGAIDFSHQTSHADVIDLVYECSFPKQTKQNSPSIALVSKFAIPLQSLLLVSIKTPAMTTTKISYFELSTVNPRAPPHHS